ncbi:hypothetical protein niasHT_025516 [Heterodera trifolii]|uniref:BED-type domain-containing protein n=1 Tax=Heterodera trifolii TaxID=157864 RepID=A0ABD2J8W6_9BILA
MVRVAKLLKCDYSADEEEEEEEGIDVIEDEHLQQQQQQVMFNDGDKEEEQGRAADHHPQNVHDEHGRQHVVVSNGGCAKRSGGDASALALAPPPPPLSLYREEWDETESAAATSALRLHKRGRVRDMTSADELPEGTLDFDKPKHSYWRYFRRDRAIARAECRMCGRSIQMGEKASTGGMRRHLQSLHFGIFIDFIAEREAHPRGGANSSNNATNSAIAAAATMAQQKQRHNQQQQQLKGQQHDDDQHHHHHHQMALRKRRRHDDGAGTMTMMAFDGDGGKAMMPSKSAQNAVDGAKHLLLNFDYAADNGSANFAGPSSAAGGSNAYGSGAVVIAPGSSSNSRRLSRHAIKTEIPEPQLSPGLETSLHDSLKLLLTNHHNPNHQQQQQRRGVQQQQQLMYYNNNSHHHGDNDAFVGGAGGDEQFMDGQQMSSQQVSTEPHQFHHQHRSISSNTGGIVVDSGGEQFNSPVSSQERLHQMVLFSSAAATAAGGAAASSSSCATNNGTVMNGGGGGGGCVASSQNGSSTTNNNNNSSTTSRGARRMPSSSSALATSSTLSSLRGISDAELVGRLQTARERLQDALDMIDSLQRELCVRQQLQLRGGGGRNFGWPRTDPLWRRWEETASPKRLRLFDNPQVASEPPHGLDHGASSVATNLTKPPEASRLVCRPYHHETSSQQAEPNRRRPPCQHMTHQPNALTTAPLDKLKECIF